MPNAIAPDVPWLGAATRWSLVVIALTLPAPLALGHGPSYLAIPAAFGLVVYLLTVFESREHRTPILQLTVVAFAWRWVLLIACTLLQESAGTLVLGPDGLMYLDAAGAIVDAGFRLPQPSSEYFATFDTAHMFVFAGVMRLVGPSLLVLNVFNTTLATLIVPMTYLWTVRVAPTVALRAALVTAAFTSITYFTAIDLLKDGSVITATVAAIYGLSLMCHGDLRRWRLFAVAVVTGLILTYVHMSRFYPLFYLEIAAAVTALLLFVRRHPIGRGAAAAVLGTFLIAEAVPASAGWPVSPVAFAAAYAQATNADALRFFSAGLLERMESDAPRSQARPRYQLREQDRARLGTNRPTLAIETDDAHARTSSFGSVGWSVQIVRRMLGPFIWIPPPSLAPRDLLAGDYLLYPGMVFWYALLPWMAVGCALAGWGVLRGTTPFVLGVTVVYVVLYLGQYLVINLSYRQREALFPLLVVFAWIGIDRFRRSRAACRMYMAYWIALGAVAAIHVIIRARVLE
jgi:hypothetical protein